MLKVLGEMQRKGHCGTATKRSITQRFCHLKVVGNEKQWGSGRSQMLDNGLGPWRSRSIFNLNMQFSSKISYFLFRL